uniref:Phorbol-ester/DAG-type domain-containing protein n=1 Tax=Psilocybe cubensis TaxID=181762 RepID=A0A8H8CNC3_PSICU
MTEGSNRNNLSRIDTDLNFTFNVYKDPWEPTVSPNQEHFKEPASPGGIPVSPISRTSFSYAVKSGPDNLSGTNNRALNESRKLLSHVLIQLANRTKPESIVDTLTNAVNDPTERGFGALAESLKEAVKLGSKQENRSHKRSGNVVDDSDSENDSTFTTDNTIELMMQLKDVLTMSLSQGWQIFDDRTILQHLQQLQGLSSLDEQNAVHRQNGFNGENDEDDPVVSIQIEEAPTDGSPSTLGSTFTSVPQPSKEVQSTNNPRQPAAIYHLAFLLPPLIGAIFDNLDTLGEGSKINGEISTRVDGLLRLIANSKLDTYNDLLEIIAYRGAKARRMAVAFLARLWPSSVGHAIISSPFCVFDDAHSSYSHHFVPWHFGRLKRRTRIAGTLHEDCRSCLKPISEFALLCPLCMTAVHFDCYDYPEGNYDVQYFTTDDAPVRVAMFKFSDLPPNPSVATYTYNPCNHKLKPATWFTLCLCFVCWTPLWGCFAQGLKCESCQISIHKDCVASLDPSRKCGFYNLSSKEITINWATFRSSCLVHFPILQLTNDQLNNHSYEEIIIFYSVLQIQMQIIVNGIELGSVVIAEGKQNTKQGSPQLKTFELHHAIERCQVLLDSGQLQYSPLTQQFVQDNEEAKFKPSIMFDWSYLEYITATIKTSFPQSRNTQTTSNLLNVDQFTNIVDEDAESIAYPFESTSLMHMKHILAVDFTIRSDFATQLILNQLHHLSFFERVDRSPFPFESISDQKDAQCMFPLPLGLDLSMNVETLVSSVEASLSDLDLSTNEFGFLLLTRRFWPNGLASEYGLKRLATRVIQWILDEDDNLAVILREFVAKQKPLPGVRYERYGQPWPMPSELRPGLNSMATNGGDYVATRRSLISRFALPWLFELRALHPDFYCQTVFDTCQQSVDSRNSFEIDTLLETGNPKNLVKRCDDLLRAIVKLCQCSIIFDAFDDIYTRWINLVIELNQADKPMMSLIKLWGNDADTIQRSTVIVDPTSDPSLALYVDPLRTISNLARESPSGLSKSLTYLSSVIKCGISIPITSFKLFLKLTISDKDNCLQNANLLSKAILLTLWLRSSGRQDLRGVISSLQSHLAPKILESLRSGVNSNISVSVIRRSLAACLRLYGCERSSIIAAGMVLPEELEDLPSRRKLNVRGSTIVDPVFIEREVLNALHLYLQSNSSLVTSFVAKFLNLFIMSDPPLLESFEIDNFILQNGKLLSFCAWNVYDIQNEDLAIVRTNLLLRSLLIDPEHFQETIRTWMDPSICTVQQRLSGVNRLFRMISDVTSPAFNVDGRQWRSSVIEIFYAFFTALWADPNEEIRIAVRTFSSVLLPVHFEIISQCWSESLVKAPITDRVRLVGFLIQLRPHFPAWKVLGWEQIMETLMEYDYDLNGADVPFSSPRDLAVDEKAREFYNLSSIDPDLSHLRMLADGVEIDKISVMKLKVQFVKIAGFSRVIMVPTLSGQSFHLQFDDISDMPESAYPCVEELLRVIDAPQSAKLPYAAIGISNGPDDKTINALIGSVFLDASLCILGKLRELSSLPVLTLKCALETLYIAIQKYDFEDRLFRHLQPLLRGAVLRTIELLSKDISYELRQLSLSIAQASIKKWHTFLGATVATILELVASEIASQIQNSQDALVVQGKFLIGTTLQTFCQNGLLIGLMRRPLEPHFFTVLAEIFKGQGKDGGSVSHFICDPLLRDTLSRAVECDPSVFLTILQSIANFVEIVYHEGYSSDLLIFTGQHLTHLVRRLSDGTIEGADPAPILSMSATLLRSNKKHSKDLLPYIETVVRAVSNRLHVKVSSLTILIQAAILSRPKNTENNGTLDIVALLFEILLDGFRMKTKILPLTIKSLIECLTTSEDANTLPPSSTHSLLFRNLADDAFLFLQNSAWHDESIDPDFQAAVATGRLLLSIGNQDPSILHRFIDQQSDKYLRLPLSIRTWNVLLLAILQENNDDWTSMIFGYFSAFSNTYSMVLRTYVTSGISSAAAATTDVNQVHISMKLWLKIADSVSKFVQGGETVVYAVWNELWPGFEGFLGVLETEAQVGLYPTLTSLACTSVAELLLYVHALKSSLALDTASHTIILNRLRSLARGDSLLSGRIARAVKTMSEPPTETLRSNILFEQIGKELIAAEKIRIMESKRDYGRMPGERSRKEGRALAT